MPAAAAFPCRRDCRLRRRDARPPRLRRLAEKVGKRPLTGHLHHLPVREPLVP